MVVEATSTEQKGQDLFIDPNLEGNRYQDAQRDRDDLPFLDSPFEQEFMFQVVQGTSYNAQSQEQQEHVLPGFSYKFHLPREVDGVVLPVGEGTVDLFDFLLSGIGDGHPTCLEGDIGQQEENDYFELIFMCLVDQSSRVDDCPEQQLQFHVETGLSHCGGHRLVISLLYINNPSLQWYYDKVAW